MNAEAIKLLVGKTESKAHTHVFTMQMHSCIQYLKQGFSNVLGLRTPFVIANSVGTPS